MSGMPPSVTEGAVQKPEPSISSSVAVALGIVSRMLGGTAFDAVVCAVDVTVVVFWASSSPAECARTLTSHHGAARAPKPKAAAIEMPARTVVACLDKAIDGPPP